ncbi:hypothetical protein Sme01_33620 [Sphaerisporangium melleum]|uniref:Uncharacterized protein n=1 Tax=Sphaerisporangium melleum TaxID=321316 RepID=A0A917QX53_9ACTN|nr:hypothetical protein GCM10007964_16280 [Sphaerisporangium melleum]GII70886.1 hypothetical protein Sme01_33620 [Sphaerisporangium melleum]
MAASVGCVAAGGSPAPSDGPPASPVAVQAETNNSVAATSAVAVRLALEERIIAPTTHPPLPTIHERRRRVPPCVAKAAGDLARPSDGRRRRVVPDGRATPRVNAPPARVVRACLDVPPSPGRAPVDRPCGC